VDTMTGQLRGDATDASDPAVSPVIDVRGITKEFPGVTALDRVSLSIIAGEVHCLVGENGAGKSSLVKVLAGVDQPNAGELLLNGAPYRPRSPQDALRAGIRVLYQELNLLSYMTVEENLSFESLPSRRGLLDRKELRRQATRLLAEVGLDVPPGRPVEELGIAQMQLVELARAISADAKVLILDEPTATLTPPEVDRLFGIIRRLTARGIAVLYISHHLDEILEIGDRVTVLRNGAVAATRQVADVTIGQVIELMVGRKMSEGYPFRPEVPQGVELLTISGLVYRGNREPVSLRLAEGEILGVAGLVGSGRTEAMRAIFGADRPSAGTISVRGVPVRIASPRDAVRAGICLLTEDRKGQGLMLDMSCAQNTTITKLEAVTRRGLLQIRREDDATAELIDALSIRAQSPAQLVRFLSGGNQQKVVVAKWLFADAQILIFDEPTRGIDVGAKLEIYNLIWDLAARGRGSIVVSSDLPELLGICHRIAVFSRGAIVGELARSEFSERAVLELAYRNYIDPASLQVAGGRGSNAAGTVP